MSSHRSSPRRRQRLIALAALGCCFWLGITGLRSLPAVAEADLPQLAQRPAPVSRRLDATSTPILAQANPTGEETNSATDSNGAADSAANTIQSITAPGSPGPASQYILEFNRSPIVGNRLRLSGIYPETQLGFTRPRSWQVSQATLVVRYQHSPALLGDRSFLTARINDTSVGSVPLDTPNSQIAEAVFSIPPDLIQDFNSITLLAEQQTSPTCTNPADPTLWTEVMPDSKLVLNYTPQTPGLDFSQYPYPLIDTLSLEPNRISYYQPTSLDSQWLTSLAQLQALTGRLAASSALTTQLTDTLTSLDYSDSLVILGTPAEQPVVAELALPLALQDGQWQDAEGQPIAPDVGVLMLTRLPQGSAVLVVTGNQPEGVAKAVQALVQSPNRQLGTGPAVLVEAISELPSPPDRQWPEYLPDSNDFALSQLSFTNGEPLPDSILVRGSDPSPISVGFKALPNDQFQRGSTFTLDYSYSPQVNPRTSAVEVKLDGNTIGAKRLRRGGGNHERFKVDLPAQLIHSDSELTVQFILQPREAELCGLATDDQLWGEVHSDSQFDLKRTVGAKIPDLGLFQTGFPLTMPQDLSAAAIALPDSPSDRDLEVLLALSERLGRLTRADSVKLAAYQASDITDTEKADRHWAAIGTRDRFPLPEIFSQNDFELAPELARQWQDTELQPLIDNQGLVQAVVSPWSDDHTVIAFTGQTETGLAEARNLLSWDSLFYRLTGDTVLLSRTQPNPSPFNPGDYSFISLSRAKTAALSQTVGLQQLVGWLETYWILVPLGIVLLAMLLYGISQLYLSRSAQFR